MANESLKVAPEPTVRRLPSYYRFLARLKATGSTFVSCTHIAQDLQLDPTQVRKDLSVTGIVGKPKVGYIIDELMCSIENFLGWNNVTDAFLAGAGSLGTALMGYEAFRSHGMNIVAAFDVDVRLIGRETHGRPILPIDQLVNLAARMHVHIGIITVPADAAQSVADMMITGGIKAIWNFSPARIDVPPDIIVENVQLTSSLAVLSSKLRKRLKAEQDALMGDEQDDTDD